MNPNEISTLQKPQAFRRPHDGLDVKTSIHAAFRLSVCKLCASVETAFCAFLAWATLGMAAVLRAAKQA
jgi:hypothetical protein